MPARPPRILLVPVDFSDASRRAVDHAAMVAAGPGARIVLLHVVDPQPVPTYSVLGAVPPYVVDVELESKAALEELAKVAKGLPSASSLVRVGQPTEEILLAAREQGADLLVMGTHGRRGLSRLLLGSVAEAVARRSPVPVVLVH